MLISLAKTHEPHILMTRPLWPGFFGETPRLQGARPIRSLAMSVYFIRSRQYVKIGVSVNPRARIATIQSSIPEPLEVLGIVEGDSALEAELHRRFADLRCHGEWFRDDASIRQAIASMKNAPLPHPRRKIVAPRPVAPPKGESPPPDNWRFEVKRKPRNSLRGYKGTGPRDWYYWIVRVHSDGTTVYYGTPESVFGDTPGVNSKLRLVVATAAPQEEPTP